MLIAQISDMHVKPPGELLYKRIDTTGFLERAVAHVMALDPNPDVVLATGDLVDGGKPEEYALLRRCSRRCRCRSISSPATTMRATPCARPFPITPTCPKSGFLQYAIEDLPVRLIALDTLVPGKGHGALCHERLDWLEARLGESNRPTVLFMHHPPFDCGIDAFDGMKVNEGGDRLAAIVRRTAMSSA